MYSGESKILLQLRESIDQAVSEVLGQHLASEAWTVDSHVMQTICANHLHRTSLVALDELVEELSEERKKAMNDLGLVKVSCECPACWPE